MKLPVMKLNTKKAVKKQKNKNAISSVYNHLECSLSTSIDLDNSLNQIYLNFNKKKSTTEYKGQKRTTNTRNGINEDKYHIIKQNSSENSFLIEKIGHNDYIANNSSEKIKMPHYKSNSLAYTNNVVYSPDYIMQYDPRSISSNHNIKRLQNNTNDLLHSKMQKDTRPAIMNYSDVQKNEPYIARNPLISNETAEKTLQINQGIYKRILENNYQNKIINSTSNQMHMENKDDNQFLENRYYGSNIHNEMSRVEELSSTKVDIENYNHSNNTYNSGKRKESTQEKIKDPLALSNIQRNHFDQPNSYSINKNIKLDNSKYNTTNGPAETPSNCIESDSQIKNIQLEKILANSDQSYYKDILIDLPHSFFILKNEYNLLNQKYQALVADSGRWREVNKEINLKLEDKSAEISELRKKVSDLTQQNTTLTNKQQILDQYEKENKEFRDLLNAERTYKNDEINRLVQECINLRVEKNKKEHENLKIMTEKEEYIKKYNILHLNNSLIKDSLCGLDRYVEVVFNSFTDCEMFKRIPEICLELNLLSGLKRFINQFHNEFNILKTNLLYTFQQIIQYHELMAQIKETQEQTILKLESKVESLKRETSENINYLVLQEKLYVSGETFKKSNEKLKNIENKIVLIGEQFFNDQSKKNLLEIISQQRKEIETQKMFYETKIKQMNNQIDEQEDIWDVFKD